MNRTVAQEELRSDLVPVSDYISPEFFAQENEHVWPHAWLMACRAEELDQPGSYVVFDILRESILIVRQPEGDIKAFYNVCQHRGRRLKEGCGQIGKSIFCKYHGWSWNVDGTIRRIVSRHEWEGCPNFSDDDLGLPELRVGTWAGWVFVTMDPEAPSLVEYLGDLPSHLDCFELEKTRLIWKVSAPAPVNWKVVLEAFNESYHVEATHPQTLKFSSTHLASEAHGIHSMFGPMRFDEIELANRPATMAAMQRDPRELVYESFEEMHRTLGALYLDPGLEAARRVRDELPAGTDPMTIAAKMLEFNIEEIRKTGAEWPEGLDAASLDRAGFGWHLFPNFIILLSPDGTLCYRVRPHPRDPEQCFWDIYAFGRFAPGQEPEPKVIELPDYESFLGVNVFLNDDLINLPYVQTGMHSRGFRNARTNPVQEVCISNLHRSLHRFIREGLARSTG